MENASASLLALEHLLPKEKVQPSVMQQAVEESIWEGSKEEIADGCIWTVHIMQTA